VEVVEHRLTLDLWCREEDPAPLVGAVRTALAGLDFDLPEPWTLVTLLPGYADVFVTKDPDVMRGLVRLRAVMGRVAV
jgi:hypothetical protein